MKLSKLFLAATLPLLTFTACSDDPETPKAEIEHINGVTDGGDIAGFYVLNEGNMGTNKCTLDYFDYATSSYIRNIYAERNPDVPMELGDTGNDIAVYKNRLYIVVNGSHKVEVLDVSSARRIGQLEVNSPRYVAFDGDNVYVSSYVGGDNGNGSVVKFDINTLKQTGTCSVGMMPEEMVVTDGKLYVANSTDNNGNYDDTISVIDLSSFTSAGSITAAININHLRLDSYGNMWATSRGNYYDIPGSLVLLKKNGGEYAKAETFDRDCTNLSLATSTMYYYAVTYDSNWNATNSFISVGIDAAGLQNNTSEFITDGSASSITSPYCIAVQPSNGTVIITDAKNYVSSGEVLCYSRDGKLQWKATAGDIPGHIAFVKK